MFNSKGLKRNLAAFLSAVASVASLVPQLAPYQEYIMWAAGLLGSTGLLHAASSNTLTIK